MREKATKQLFKSIKSPKVLHIATHSEDDSLLTDWSESYIGHNVLDDHLKSYLALAGANTERHKKFSDPNVGVVTAYDVIYMDLVGTELVTLSSCYSGVGTTVRGLSEAVFGFRNAFACAGAKRMVVSLWEAGDRATNEIMKKFYKKIKERTCNSCVEALQQAQREVRTEYPEFKQWAAFIFIGNPDLFDL